MSREKKYDCDKLMWEFSVHTLRASFDEPLLWRKAALSWFNFMMYSRLISVYFRCDGPSVDREKYAENHRKQQQWSSMERKDDLKLDSDATA